MHKKIGIRLTALLAQFNGILAREEGLEKFRSGPQTIKRFRNGTVVLIGNGSCDLTDFGDVVAYVILPK